MREAYDHAATVIIWMAGATRGKTPAQAVHAFELAFAAMWRRAEVTLGELTLFAIVDRVLHDAGARFPILSPVKVSSSGLDCGALKDRAAGVEPEGLSEALRFTLVQFLTVLGNLTADILTSALHAELVKLASSDETAEVAR